eukprot:CAMPEP_0174233264 /NCGR_PEP_ID=MMETSP0417-20130205/3347_1 /TAXON_ID=242541 /ORGANISM="Mayorella sp, Strain BSH-02190019" /LENGTH=579 /DNA_ID=CAMNT_0015311443 /DNA_START=66 /DNA_END=1805 /DNA_ORIENTATION=-
MGCCFSKSDEDHERVPILKTAPDGIAHAKNTTLFTSEPPPLTYQSSLPSRPSHPPLTASASSNAGYQKLQNEDLPVRSQPPQLLPQNHTLPVAQPVNLRPSPNDTAQHTVNLPVLQPTQSGPPPRPSRPTGPTPPPRPERTPAVVPPPLPERTPAVAPPPRPERTPAVAPPPRPERTPAPEPPPPRPERIAGPAPPPRPDRTADSSSLVSSDLRRATLTEEARVALVSKASVELDRIRQKKAEQAERERKLAEEIATAQARIALAQQQHLRTKQRLDEERREEEANARRRKEALNRGELLISAPQGFRQEAHVGIDADGQFNVAGIPKEWVRVLRMCGLRKRDLRDKDKARVVFGFMADADAALRQHANDPTRPFDLSTPPPPVPRSDESASAAEELDRSGTSASALSASGGTRLVRPSYGPPPRPPRAAPAEFPAHHHPASVHAHQPHVEQPPPLPPRDFSPPMPPARPQQQQQQQRGSPAHPSPAHTKTPPAPPAPRVLAQRGQSGTTTQPRSLQDAIRNPQLRRVEVSETPAITAQQENVLCTALLRAMAAAGHSVEPRDHGSDGDSDDDETEWSD